MYIHQRRAAASSSSSSPLVQGSVQQPDTNTDHTYWSKTVVQISGTWHTCHTPCTCVYLILHCCRIKRRLTMAHTSRGGLISPTACCLLASTPVSSSGGSDGMGTGKDTGVFSLSSITGISIRSPKSSSGSRTAS